MTRPPCFICDDLNPAYADMLCRTHWLLDVVREFVRCGAWSEFAPDACGRRPNHAAMQTSDTIAYARKRVLAERDATLGGVGLAREIRRWAEEGAVLEQAGATYDTSGHESAGDGLWRERGIVAHWIRDEMERVIVERRKGQAA